MNLDPAELTDKTGTWTTGRTRRACSLGGGVPAHGLGLRTVAEGVERPGQLRELTRLGCDLVQGHLIARPAAAAEITPTVLADSPVIAPHLLQRPG